MIKLALIILLVVSLIELAMWLSNFWQWRKGLAAVNIVSLSIATGLLVGARPAVWSFLILFISVYRVINLLRLIEGRTQADYLFYVARRSSGLLILAQLLVLALTGLFATYHISKVYWLDAILVLQVLTSVILLISTLRHLKTTRFPTINTHYTDKELPSLSVAIPARNETQDLEDCLNSLITSNYPKLEILVLDDCSQNKRTPGIIRDFAHAGVRFVEGKVPPDNYLAKTYAYEQLAEQASGDIILFCGVDTRFEIDTLKLMVETLLSRKKSMISFMPLNNIPGIGHFERLLVQPGRYAWELGLPRRWLKRPPVLSTCWLIKADTLSVAGGFKAVAHSVAVESYFARYCVNHDDSYSFIQGGSFAGLLSVKSFREQRATAIRTRYPQLHRRPELVGLLSLSQLVLIFLPFCEVIYALIVHSQILLSVSLATVFLLSVFFSLIVTVTYRRFALRSLLLLPFAVIYDVGLLNYSMWQYEFREVIWKGRNVCLPVMHIVAGLPKLN